MLKTYRALYWGAPDRTYKLTQQEQDSGIVICPYCKSKMNTEKFTRSDKLLVCSNCDFKIPTSKVVSDTKQIQVTVPDGVDVSVTKLNKEGDEVSGKNIVATRRGRFAFNNENLSQKSLSDLAFMIYQDWKPVNYAAKPYLEAMSSMNSIRDRYYQDPGFQIVGYFLSNASSWRGPVAKAVKAELKKRLKSY